MNIRFRMWIWTPVWRLEFAEPCQTLCFLLYESIDSASHTPFWGSQLFFVSSHWVITQKIRYGNFKTKTSQIIFGLFGWLGGDCRCGGKFWTQLTSQMLALTGFCKSALCHWAVLARRTLLKGSEHLLLETEGWLDSGSFWEAVDRWQKHGWYMVADKHFCFFLAVSVLFFFAWEQSQHDCLWNKLRLHFRKRKKLWNLENGDPWKKKLLLVAFFDFFVSAFFFWNKMLCTNHSFLQYDSS